MMMPERNKLNNTGGEAEAEAEGEGEGEGGSGIIGVVASSLEVGCCVWTGVGLLSSLGMCSVCVVSFVPVDSVVVEEDSVGEKGDVVVESGVRDDDSVESLTEDICSMFFCCFS
jgi:hypothetical protein